MDDCIQEVMLRCMQGPSITAVRPIVPVKLTQRNSTKSLDHEILVTSDPVP